jgi:hypothetical protein
MKKWLYVLSPLAMLGLFLLFYLPAKDEMRAKENAQLEAAKEKHAKEEADKAAIEDRARQDAIKHDEERKAEEKAKADKKAADWAEEGKKIQNDTDLANADIEKYGKKVSDLEIQLDTLHKKHDSITRESFEVGREVELAEINRRNAEFDIQRMLEMIRQRLDQSLLLKQQPSSATPTITVPSTPPANQ